jgi:hypothetical protein
MSEMYRTLKMMEAGLAHWKMVELEARSGMMGQ